MDQPSLNLPRAIGVLLHPTALPGNTACGTFGTIARKWLQLLSKNGIGVWQLLPLSQADVTGSPYSSPSSFAFNPWFLDVYDLAKEGFISSTSMDSLPGANEISDDSVDFRLAERRSESLGRLLIEAWSKQDSIRHHQFKVWCDQQFW